MEVATVVINNAFFVWCHVIKVKGSKYKFSLTSHYTVGKNVTVLASFNMQCLQTRVLVFCLVLVVQWYVWCSELQTNLYRICEWTKE
jgi:hypothetical protein